MEGSLMCEMKNCGDVAKAFVLEGKSKVKCCSKHLNVHLQQYQPVCAIEGFSFICSYDDIAVFEERMLLVEMARRNFELLEEVSKEQLSEAKRQLQVEEHRLMDIVHRSFQELAYLLDEQYHRTQQGLATLRVNIEQFVKVRESMLTQTELLVCSNLTVTPRFLRSRMPECCFAVAKAIRQNWKGPGESLEDALRCLDLQQRPALIESLLREARSDSAALEEARTFGFAGDESSIRLSMQHKQAQDALQLETLLRHSSTAEEANRIAGMVMQIALAEKAQHSMTESFQWLRDAWRLLEGHSLTASGAALGEAFGEALALQKGELAEADRILRLCLAAREDFLGEGGMTVCIKIISAYYNCGRYIEAEEFSRWVLSIHREARHPAKLYWTVLLYLSFSLGMQLKHVQAISVVEEWCEVLGDTEQADEDAELVRLVVLSRHAARKGCDTEAMRLVENAHKRAVSQVSEIAALAFRTAGVVYSDKGKITLALDFFVEASQVYKIVAPMSVQAALNLYNIGITLKQLNRLLEAEDSYLMAHTIFTFVAPDALDTAHNLFSLGLTLEASGKMREAEQQFNSARDIYERNGCSEWRKNVDSALTRVAQKK